MSKYTGRAGALLLVAATVLAGCKGDSSKTDSTALRTDSTLNRDLALAGRDTTVQPQLKDVPPESPAQPSRTAEPTRREVSRETPRPVHRAAQSGPIHRAADRPSAPLPPPGPVTTVNGNTATTNTGAAASPGASGGGAVGTIAAGATLTGQANSRICTNTNAVGDHVSATLANSVAGSNGASIPAGATLNLTITSLKRSNNSNDPIVMEFAVNSVSFGGRTYPIDGTVTSASVDRVRDESQSKDIEKVGVGAVAGAIAGRILGHSTKATVIGGAVGAAGGAAAAAATAGYQGCVPSGGSIVVRLTSPATIRAS